MTTTMTFGLKRFLFSSVELRDYKSGGIVQRIVTAKNKDQAWSKFVTQYFSALKPDPKAWIIQEVNI